MAILSDIIEIDEGFKGFRHDFKIMKRVLKKVAQSRSSDPEAEIAFWTEIIEKWYGEIGQTAAEQILKITDRESLGDVETRVSELVDDIERSKRRMWFRDRVRTAAEFGIGFMLWDLRHVAVNVSSIALSTIATRNMENEAAASALWLLLVIVISTALYQVIKLFRGSGIGAFQREDVRLFLRDMNINRQIIDFGKARIEFLGGEVPQDPDELWQGPVQETSEVDEIQRGQIGKPDDDRLMTLNQFEEVLLEFEVEYRGNMFDVVIKNKMPGLKIEARDRDMGFLAFRAEGAAKFYKDRPAFESESTRRAKGDKYKGLPAAIYESLVMDYGWLILSGYAHSPGSEDLYARFAAMDSVEVLVVTKTSSNLRVVGVYDGVNRGDVYNGLWTTRLLVTPPGEFEVGEEVNG